MKSLSIVIFMSTLAASCKPSSKSQEASQTPRKATTRSYVAIDQRPPFRLINNTGSDFRVGYSGDLIEKLPLPASERTTGPLSFSDIRNVISSTTDLFLSCGPEAQPITDRSGAVMVDFTIGKDGAVRDTRVIQAQFVAEADEDRVARVIEGVRFPVRDKETLATYPFEICRQKNAEQPSSLPVDVVRTAVPAPPDVAGAPPDAKKQPDGLVTKMLAGGTGAKRPLPDDTVFVNYVCWSIDGHMVDRGQHARLLLKRIIPGWSEGIGLMTAGEKRRLWIPQNLAFNGSPPTGILVFDIELLDIKK